MLINAMKRTRLRLISRLNPNYLKPILILALIKSKGNTKS